MVNSLKFVNNKKEPITLDRLSKHFKATLFYIVAFIHCTVSFIFKLNIKQTNNFYDPLTADNGWPTTQKYRHICDLPNDLCTIHCYISKHL